MRIKYVPKKVCLIKEDGTKELIAKRLAVANTFWSRFLGLMGKKKLASGCAFLLYPCSAVHTLFMRFPIDVVYLDEDMNIVRVIRNMRPWRLDFGDRRATYTMELPAGTISCDKGKVTFEE